MGSHLGVQGLDAAVQDLGRVGVLGHVLDWKACVTDGLCCAASGQKLHALTNQEGRQLQEARLVGHGQESTLDLVHVHLGALDGSDNVRHLV